MIPELELLDLKKNKLKLNVVKSINSMSVHQSQGLSTIYIKIRCNKQGF